MFPYVKASTVGLVTVGLAVLAPQADAQTRRQGPPRPPAVVQPVLVPLPVAKCPDCASTARKRIAVMPVRIGALSAELGMPGEVVASKVRDQLEQALGSRAGLIVVSRGDLGSVLAEQQLSGTAAFNQELAPAAGRLIPAQLLLVAGIDRVDVATRTRKESNSTAADYHRRALEKERHAADLQNDAERQAQQLEISGGRTALQPMMDALNSIPCPRCNPYGGTCSPYMQQLEQQCEERKRRNVEQQERMRDMNRQMQESRIADVRRRANAELDEARFLRQQAQLEAQKSVKETRTTDVKAMLVWKALDSATGAVVATGSEAAADSSEETGTANESAFQSSSVTSSSRHDVLVNRVLGNVVEAVARAAESGLGKEPFRAKVVKIERRGVVLNAGRDLGLSVGDTFGVREKRELLTDPDTGLPLEQPGAPLGVIRVAEVFDKTALAEVIQAAGTLRRGDELEWIGMYSVVAPN